MYVNIFIYSNKLLLFVWSTLKKENKKKALNNIHFLPLFGKSLRNNALPTKLSSSLPIFSSNITNAIHFSTPPMLAHYPPYPR